MASYFGEVLGLQSRAVDDDLDDDQPVKELILELENQVDSSIELIVLAVGRPAVAFTSCYLRSQNTKPIGCMKVKGPTPKENFCGLSYPKTPQKVAEICLNCSPSNILICEVVDSITEELSFEFSKRLLSLCSKTPDCLILASAHVSNYRSDNALPQESFVKCLATSSYRTSQRSNLPYLEPPNIVTNVPAAVLTELEIVRGNAVMFVCYSDANDLDSEAIRLFEDVFTAPVICNKLSKPADASARLQDYIKRHRRQPDNLYM